jgi:flagella basal body P-ring formation protein FlgA
MFASSSHRNRQRHETDTMTTNHASYASRIGQNPQIAHHAERFVRLLSIVLLCVAATSASAAEQQSLRAIQQAALAFLQAQYHSTAVSRSRVQVMPLDPRLRFPTCRQDLQVQFANEQRKSSSPTLLVACSTPQWQVYVPARVRQERKLWVAARPLHRGERLSKADLRLSWMPSYSNFLDAEIPLEQLIGAKVLRTFRAGDAIARSAVCHVCKGDRVVAEAVQNHLLVKVEATAMQSGLAGDSIWASNWRTKRQFQGVIAKNGMLRVQLFPQPDQ